MAKNKIHFSNVGIVSILSRCFNDLMEYKTIAAIFVAILSSMTAYSILSIIEAIQVRIETPSTQPITVSVDPSAIPEATLLLITMPYVLIFAILGLTIVCGIIWSECVYEGESSDTPGIFSLIAKMLKIFWTFIKLGFLFIIFSIILGLGFFLLMTGLGIAASMLEGLVPNIAATVVTMTLTIVAFIAIILAISVIPFRFCIIFAAIAVGNKLSISEAWKYSKNNSFKIATVYSLIISIGIIVSYVAAYALFNDDISYLMGTLATAIPMQDIAEIKSVFEEVFLDFQPSFLDLFLYSMTKNIFLLLIISANIHIYEKLASTVLKKPTAPKPTPSPTPKMVIAKSLNAPEDVSHYNPFADIGDVSSADGIGTSSTSGDHSQRLI